MSVCLLFVDGSLFGVSFSFLFFFDEVVLKSNINDINKIKCYLHNTRACPGLL